MGIDSERWVNYSEQEKMHLIALIHSIVLQPDRPIVARKSDAEKASNTDLLVKFKEFFFIITFICTM